jgi:TonB family protein
MRFSLVCGFFLLLSFGDLCAAPLPDMRPTLLGTGRKSLINLIDTERLVKLGQGDGIVRFSCWVSDLGFPFGMITYRSSANSEVLAEEAINKCNAAEFIPAVYHYKTRHSIVCGTIVFGVINGRPRLRIYLNQEEEHLKRGDDFIGPQEVYMPDAIKNVLEYPQRGIGSSATVLVKIDLDAQGKLKASRIVSESPPGRGFGDEVMSKIGNFTFLPAYLHGKPVACSATLPIIFKSGGRGTHWNSD